MKTLKKIKKKDYKSKRYDKILRYVKKALKGPNKELAKKMLKSDVEKDIEEGGPGSDNKEIKEYI